MSYDGREIANFVLDACDATGKNVTNLALQKIIYFCHVWTLIEYQKPLLKHQFEAWEFGPVLPYLYRDFKENSSAPIKSRAKRIDPATGQHFVPLPDLEEDLKKHLLRIVDHYTKLSAGALVALSHVEDGPWHTTWNHKTKINPGMKISDDQITTFYAAVNKPFAAKTG